MSNALVLPSGVDNLTFPQKIIAGGILVGGLTVLWWLLPPLVVILTNLWLAAILAIPIVYIVYNPTLVWGVAKTISEKITKGIIGLDVLSAMDRYYDWVVAREQATIESRKKLAATLNGVKTQVAAKEQSYRELLSRADTADKMGNKVESQISANKAVADKQFLTTMIPIRDSAQQKVEYMDELISAFRVNREQLQYTIESKKLEYKSLKDMEKGLSDANAVIGGNNEATKLFNESLNQLADQMNKFTANIETFEQNIKPMLEGAKFDKQLAEIEGQKLLAEFRQTNFQLNAAN